MAHGSHIAEVAMGQPADELIRWPGQHEYEYTPPNLLASVTHNSVQGEPVSSMTWDADSNRITFTSSQGGTYTFVYDVTAGIPAVIEEVTPSGSVYYIREPNGALVARVAGGSTHYYHFDALGSTRLLTDSSGLKTDKYTYDAWGNLAAHQQFSGSVDQPYQFVGQLGYYTHVQDENMSLLQLGVRFYDPETGRFTQVDAAGIHSETTYAYTADSPCAWVDPWGLKRRAIGGDAVLQKCLSKLRRCYPSIGGAIDKVGGSFYGDPGLDAGGDAAYKFYHVRVGFNFLQGVLVVVPEITFNTTPGEKWSQRGTKFDTFCKEVLHELLHIKHGFWMCTYRDAFIELRDDDYFFRRAEFIYEKHCSGS